MCAAAAEYEKPRVREAVIGVLAVAGRWGDGGGPWQSARRRFAALAQFKCAPSTWISHWRAWKRLVSWYRSETEAGRVFRLIPLSEFHMARAMGDLLVWKRSISAVRSFRAGVNAVHLLHCLPAPAPAGSALASVVVSASKRLLGKPAVQRSRLTIPIIRQVVSQYVRVDSKEWELELALFFVLQMATFNRWNDMTALRTDSMLVLLKGQAVPRVLSLAQFSRATNVAAVFLFLAGSKTDRSWKGRWQGVGASGKMTCPVRLLQRVLSSRVAPGYLFRAILRKGAWKRGLQGEKVFSPTMGLGLTRCGGAQYRVYRDLFVKTLVSVAAGSLTYKQVASCWGLHSGRVAGATRAALVGVPGWLRRKQGGWSAGSAARAVSDNYVQDLMSLALISVQMGL